MLSPAHMNAIKKQQYLRKIPSVDDILRRAEIQGLSQRFPRSLVVKAVQMLLTEKRELFLSRENWAQFLHKLDNDITLTQVEAKLSEMLQPSLRRVINATGIVVHTNLGRAPLAEEAINFMVEVAGRYSNLELDILKGTRGSRNSHVVELLKHLTMAQDAMVVNNNAAAVLICLHTLAKGKEVIISRGELIEIGGSFRIPEVMEQSGATIREVGTTNRTHLEDYRDAINENTAMLLKVHPSNYKIVGFTSEIALENLMKLGAEFQVPVMLDMGSGNLIEPSRLGLRGEPVVSQVVSSGADITTFSGDKLLGGTQAGIIIGKSTYISRIAKNPLARALRVDKLTLAALEATLRIYYLKPEHFKKIPVLGMLTMPEATLRSRAQSIVKKLKRYSSTITVEAARDVSKVGGGAYPLHELPTWVVTIGPHNMTAQAFEAILRRSTPPVITRINRDRILLDMRTLFPEEVAMVVEIISKALKSRQ